MEFLKQEFGCKLLVFNICVFQSPNLSGSVIESYNTVLSMPSLLNYSDLTFFVDNEALYNICEKKLKIDYANF